MSENRLAKLTGRLHTHANRKKNKVSALVRLAGCWSSSCGAYNTMEESYTIKWEEVEVVNHHLRHRQRCALEDWTKWHKMKRDTKVHAFSVQLTSPPVIFISPTDFVGEHPLLCLHMCPFTLPTVVAMLITS